MHQFSGLIRKTDLIHITTHQSCYIQTDALPQNVGDCEGRAHTITSRETLPKFGKWGDGSPRRDVGPSCGSRSRQPVGRFPQAWNAARDSQPQDLRARITLKDQAAPQVDTADDAD